MRYYILICLMVLASKVVAYEYVGSVYGQQIGDQFGSSFCTVDFNGDGFVDLVVGASATQDNGLASGKVYLYYGGPASDTVADLVFVGVTSSFFGKSLASAGDFNNDGVEDLLVGAPFYDQPASNAGAVFLYFGGVTPDTSVDHVFTGEAASDYFGISIAGVGDFNDDNYDDIVVGAYRAEWGAYSNSGKAYVFFGGPSADVNVDRLLVGSADGERFGYAVTSGDFNADSKADIAVGAYSYDGAKINMGRIYLFYGGLNPDTLIDITMTGVSAGNKFGWSLTTGRCNADAYDDLVMGTDGFEVDTFAVGQVYLFHGGPSMDGNADDSFDLGRVANDYFGFSVASGVDLTSDGYDEIIGGMPGYDDGVVLGGGAAVLRVDPPLAADTIVIGNSIGEELGHAVELWKDFGSTDNRTFVVSSIAYDSFRGRILFFQSQGTAPNQRPQINVPANATAYSDMLFEITITASDLDGTIPALFATSLPGTATFIDHNDGSGTFSWTPIIGDVGSHSATFVADDGSLADTATVTINVVASNQKPQLTVPAYYFGYPDSLMEFSVSATASNGTIPALSATNLPATATFLDHGNGSGTFSWTPLIGDIGSHSATFVADDGSLADTATVPIQIFDQSGCCQGFAGNTDCDPEDKHNLADITRLIDRVYVSKDLLCCEAAGNTDGDLDSKLNLADITRLIDNVYVSKEETAACL